MTITSTEYKHIQLNENNVPLIAGTTMKVVELITSVKAYQWTPEELHENYPHVSMSKIYAALSYYWDHKEEIDSEMERIEQWVDKMRQEAGETHIVKDLKAKGLI
ncbi:MAG: DUF433 domain-containing protein [Moorea sp. SIO2B7]|nr:DUF433 domain-containing protein [Moorena sp. SIO2B7]